MVSRRKFLKGLGLGAVLSASFGGYALAEPYRLTVTRYEISPDGWPDGLHLRLAVIADIHACDPWMTTERIAQIVRRANAVAPDAILLLGDYVVGHRLGTFGRKLIESEWAAPLADLTAPLGVFGVLGNHDWWDDHEVQNRRKGPPRARRFLEAAKVKVLENDAVRISKNGSGVWIGGLGDQWAFWPRDRRWRGRGEIPYEGVDDVDGMLAKVTTDEPLIVMAHEPDIFATLPKRVSLTLSGHTHGGQVRVLGFAPIVPSRFGRRYTYGHIVEDGRQLIVSGGLGCSGFPVRFGSPPEIVVIDLMNADKKV